MCTTTWWRPSQGAREYAVFFNRDESKARAPALPPELRKTDSGRSYIAPIDGARRGTWIAVNEAGLTLAILNHYAVSAGGAPHDFRSRGEIPLLLAGARGIPEAKKELESIEHSQFRPFFLFAISPSEGPVLWEWDGDHLRLHEKPHQPITTSSFDSDRVIHSRERTFQSLPRPLNLKALDAFHQSGDSNEGALGIRMRRPDAQTVSLSRINVGPDSIQFAYRPEVIDSEEILPVVTTMIPLKAAFDTK